LASILNIGNVVIYIMDRPKFLGLGLLAVVTLFSIVAVTPGVIDVSSTIQIVNAVESTATERECLSSSSALFFDSQPPVPTSSV
jgi:hypothetical protein